MDFNSWEIDPTALEAVTDSRRTDKGNIKYLLSEVLLLCIVAILSNCREYDQIEEFGKNELAWLRRYYPYKNGIPPAITIARIISLVNPKELNNAYSILISALVKNNSNKHIAIDGKVISGYSKHHPNNDTFVNVSAYITDDGITLAQVSGGNNKGEIRCLEEILDFIDIDGALITLDAGLSFQSIARKITNKGGNYVLSVKKNNPKLFDDIEKVFEKENYHTTDITHNQDHGRVETRSCLVINDLSEISTASDWKGIKSVMCVVRTRRKKGDKSTSTTKQYYISNLASHAIDFNRLIRNHWQIENCLHWSLDVVFDEDNSKKRNFNAVANLSLLTKLTDSLLNHVKKEYNIKGSKKIVCQRVLMNPEFRSFLMNIILGCSVTTKPK